MENSKDKNIFKICASWFAEREREREVTTSYLFPIMSALFSSLPGSCQCNEMLHNYITSNCNVMQCRREKCRTLAPLPAFAGENAAQKYCNAMYCSGEKCVALWQNTLEYCEMCVSAANYNGDKE